MKIIYNPKNGAPIEKFVVDGVGLLEPHLIGEMKQYDDKTAQILLDIYGFLEELTPKRAQEILAKPKEGSLKCEYCDFSTDVRVALVGHNRSHKAEIAKANEPQIDPTLVPVAGARQVESPKVAVQVEELPKGPDQDGVGWYGEGMTESLSKVIPEGQEGHFGAA